MCMFGGLITQFTYESGNDAMTANNRNVGIFFVCHKARLPFLAYGLKMFHLDDNPNTFDAEIRSSATEMSAEHKEPTSKFIVGSFSLRQFYFFCFARFPFSPRFSLCVGQLWLWLQLRLCVCVDSIMYASVIYYESISCSIVQNLFLFRIKRKNIIHEKAEWGWKPRARFVRLLVRARTSRRHIHVGVWYPVFPYNYV